MIFDVPPCWPCSIASEFIAASITLERSDARNALHHNHTSKAYIVVRQLNCEEPHRTVLASLLINGPVCATEDGISARELPFDGKSLPHFNSRVSATEDVTSQIVLSLF